MTSGPWGAHAAPRRETQPRTGGRDPTQTLPSPPRSWPLPPAPPPPLPPPPRRHRSEHPSHLFSHHLHRPHHLRHYHQRHHPTFPSAVLAASTLNSPSFPTTDFPTTTQRKTSLGSKRRFTATRAPFGFLEPKGAAAWLILAVPGRLGGPAAMPKLQRLALPPAFWSSHTILATFPY